MITPDNHPAALLIAIADEVPPLFFRLRALAEQLHQDTGINAPARAVLHDLVQLGAMTAPELAKLRSVTRQAVQPVLDQLFAQGLVGSMPNPRHKRSPRFQATDRGLALHRAMYFREQAALERLVGQLDVSALQSGLSALRTLSQLLRTPGTSA